MHKTGTILWAFKRHIPLITNRSSGLTHACKSFLAFWEPLDHTSHLLMIGSQTLPPCTHTSLFRQKGAPACKSPWHWFLLSIQRDVLFITVKIRERHPMVSSWFNERRNERWTLFFNRSSNASDYANLWDTSLKIPQIEGGWKKNCWRSDFSVIWITEKISYVAMKTVTAIFPYKP